MSYSQPGSSVDRSRERESRHLWVGGLPDNIDEAGIKDYFARYGKIEGVKILPQKYPNIGVAAFIDFYDVRSAKEAKEAKHRLNGNELRTNYKSNHSSKYDSGSKAQDDEMESESSSSGSESGSSSSSSSSDSDRESTKKGRKKGGSSGLFIKVTGLATNRSDTVLLDGLLYEFTQHSTNVMVRLYGDMDKKWALIKFKRADKCREAFTHSQGLVLFGSRIKLTLVDLDDFPPGGRDQSHVGGDQFLMEDLDPLATRSLFVGNIPKHISVYELRDAFHRYGNVLDVEIKKMGGNATYGFILYYDLRSAITAKRYMDGHNLKGNNIRVGFGKGTASKQLWIDGIDPSISESQLEHHLAKYGKIMKLGIDRLQCCAMVQYDSMESAKEALTSVKGTRIRNSKKLMTDFANRDARAAFFSRVEGGKESALPPGPHRGFPGPPAGMFGSDMMGGDPRMMMPRPGAMHMMGRGGGFPPHGHPMDYYFNPYMDDFYGGRPPYGPPGMRGHYPPGPGGGPYGREGGDDYEEELRAFSRKRRRERERRFGSRRHRSSSDSEGSISGEKDENDDDDEDSGSRKKRKATKGREKGKKVSKKPKDREISDEGETDSDSDDYREEARLKATRKSRDLREKLKKKPRRKVKSSVSSEEDNSEEEIPKQEVSKHVKKNKSAGRVEEQEKSLPKGKGRRSSPSPEQSSPPPPKTHKSKQNFSSSPPPKALSSKPPRRGSPHTPSPREVPSKSRRSSTPQTPPLKEPPKMRRISTPQTPPPKERPESRQSSTPLSPPSKELPAASRRHSSPHTPPPKAKLRRGEEEEELVDSEDSGLHVKPRAKETQRMKERAHHLRERVGAESVRQHTSSKARAPQRDRGTIVRKSEERDSLDGDKTSRGSDMAALVKTNEKVQQGTPRGSIVSTKSSHSSPRGNVESDLSSGEDFKEDWGGRERAYPESEEWSNRSSRPYKSRQEGRDHMAERRGPSPGMYSPQPRTPDYPVDPPRTPEWREGIPHTPPLPSDEEDGRIRDMDRKGRKLPRRYQIDPPEPGPGRRQEGSRYREGKDIRQERRYHMQQPSPSPPPYSGYQRKRFHHSPPPPEGNFEGRRRRGRPYSPVGGFQRRRYSRSPPYQGSPPPPPPHRGKSPYGASPPHSRPRSPIPRARGPRHRYESPPFENLRERVKYPRRRSPPSPHHRFIYSPSPPPPRSSARSPPVRRFGGGRRRSASLSPPRIGRGGRRDRSPLSDHMHASPRAPEDRHEIIKRHKRGAYSRSPSPRDKYREIVKEDSEPKRRRVEEMRPKSPSSSPPPPREASKNEPARSSRQQGQVAEQRNFKQQSSSQSTGSLHRQPSSDVGKKPSTPTTTATSTTTTTTPSINNIAQVTLPKAAQSNPVAPPENSLMDLLRRYPVMWQGHLMLKNDAAAVQLHFLSGNVQLANSSLPPQQTERGPPILRISQRMRLEKTQLEGVERRIKGESEHCLLLALPCGRDASDVHTQTHALKNNLINYLIQKQAAGIINIQGQGGSQNGYVLHIFPPCPFSQSHLSRVAPDLLSSASANCHLMIVVATM